MARLFNQTNRLFSIGFEIHFSLHLKWVCPFNPNRALVTLDLITLTSDANDIVIPYLDEVCKLTNQLIGAAV